MATSTMTRKGQVTIPKDIRDELGLAAGDRVFFVRRGDEIVLKVLRGNILGLRGSILARQRPENFDTIRKATKRKVASKITRDG